MKNSNNLWLSAHLYFNGDIYSSICDTMLLKVVSSIIKECDKKSLFIKYFFIRYNEYGPHIRLRFNINRTEQLKTIKNIILKNVRNNFPSDLFFIPQTENKNFIDADNPSILWVDYEPEFIRYGGEEAIKIAEDYFHYSSKTAIELVKQMNLNDESDRLAKGLLATLVLIYTFLPDRIIASNFINNYSHSYLSAFARNDETNSIYTEAFNNGFNRQSEKLVEFINKVWNALENGYELTEALDTYKANLEIIKEKLKKLYDLGLINKEIKIESWYNCVRMILPSYVHMMNNRLGIQIKDEAYLAFLINKAIISKEITEEKVNDE